MQTFTNKLLIELENKLNIIELECNSLLKRSELSFYLTKEIIEKLKDFIIKYKFKSEAEEIRFFKEIKPQFTSKRIYHLMVYNIETKTPNGGKEVLKRYLTKELEKLKHYFDYNLDFYRYYRGNATYLDQKYFIREKYDLQLTLDGHIFENDTRFSTTHDFKVAKILAHDLLQVFIEAELASIDVKDSLTEIQELPKSLLNWSASKTDCVELIYALYLTQSVNGGNVDLKELTALFQRLFNVHIDDLYKMFLQIKERKSNPTKFIDSLKQALLAKLKEK